MPAMQRLLHMPKISFKIYAAFVELVNVVRQNLK